MRKDKSYFEQAKCTPSPTPSLRGAKTCETPPHFPTEEPLPAATAAATVATTPQRAAAFGASGSKSLNPPSSRHYPRPPQLTFDNPKHLRLDRQQPKEVITREETQPPKAGVIDHFQPVSRDPSSQPLGSRICKEPLLDGVFLPSKRSHSINRWKSSPHVAQRGSQATRATSLVLQSMLPTLMDAIFRCKGIPGKRNDHVVPKGAK